MIPDHLDFPRMSVYTVDRNTADANAAEVWPEKNDSRGSPDFPDAMWSRFSGDNEVLYRYGRFLATRPFAIFVTPLVIRPVSRSITLNVIAGDNRP